MIVEARCRIKLLKTSRGSIAFYDFDEYERLVAAAKTISTQAHLIVLRGGEAGLRSGEMVALEWTDLDLVKRMVCVQRSAWEGHVDSPKGGRIRYIRLTTRLAAALREARHFRGPRVLYRDDGRPFSEMSIGTPSARTWRCGAAPRAIQELAGHAQFTTTQRYMHLSPATLDGAIDLLERPLFEGHIAKNFGDMMETGQA